MQKSTAPFDHQIRPRPRAAVLAVALVLALAGGAAGAEERTPAAGGDAHGGHGAHGEATTPAREPTIEERAAADALLAATRDGTARLEDPAVAEAEGYIQATPFAFYGLRAAHFHNERYNRDGKLLDPERPEDLMYLKTPDGRLDLIGVMFIAPPGEGPRVAGPLTDWHTHDDLCGGEQGVVAKAPDGTCPANTYPITFEMLHVWLIETPAGPFADRPTSADAGPLVGAGSEHNSLVVGVSLIDGPGLLREVGALLRLTPEEIGQRYEAGESLAEMAAAQGVERAALVALMTDWLTAEFDRAVAQDDMTAAQRDLIVQNLPVQVERMVDIHRDEPWLKT